MTIKRGKATMHTLRIPLANRHGQAGFTLVEALVALVVMAFGMFAVAGFQITMSRNSEVAKQRSEAVRLAQQKMEELRSFSTTTSDGVGLQFDYVSDVVTGAAETIAPTSANSFAGNTSYTRNWTVTRMDGTASVGADLEKWINVSVAWQDRTGQDQSVTLRSVISRSDPIDLGTLFTGPGETKTRSPKNRNINIPYPARTLAGNKSSFKPPPSDRNYVFDNDTGLVLGYCSDDAINSSLQSNAALAFDNPDTVALESATTGCTSAFGYLLSGYVHFLNTVPSSGNERNDDIAVTNPNVNTQGLTARVALVSGSSADCFAQPQKVVRANGTISSKAISSATRAVASGTNADGSANDTVTIATSGNHGFETGHVVSVNGIVGYEGQFSIVKLSNTTFSYKQEGSAVAGVIVNGGSFATLVQDLTIADSETPAFAHSVESRFVAYTCVVTPVDHDSDAATSKIWSGQFWVRPSVEIASASRTVVTGGDASAPNDVVTIETLPADGDHGFVTGQKVSISGVSGFDGLVTVTRVNATSFTYNQEGSAGAGVIVAASLATPDKAGPWAIGAADNAAVGSGNTRKLCRFTGDYVKSSENVMSNNEHPLHYRAVTSSLDNQNYLAVPWSTSCPTDDETSPLAMDYINTNTVRHQTNTTGASSFGGNLSVGAQWGGGSAGEPSDTAQAIPML